MKGYEKWKKLLEQQEDTLDWQRIYSKATFP